MPFGPFSGRRSAPPDASTVPALPRSASIRADAGPVPVQGTYLSLLLWLTMVVVWLTWAPFVFQPGEVSLTLALPTNARDVLGNLFLLAPLACVWTAAAQRGVRRAVPRAVAGALLVGVGLEAVQWALAGRVVSPYDPVLNAAGAGLAAWLTVQAVRRGAGPASIAAAVASGVFVLVAVLMVEGYLRGQREFRLDGWDPSFRIALGDEPDGGRRYIGDVHEAWICAGRGADRVCAGPSADVEQRRRLVAVAEESQRVDLRAEVQSATDAQEGPARIVTFSEGPSARNVTLGQEGRALVLRLRGPLMGPNGADFELHLPDAVRAGESVVTTAIFERGEVTVRAKSADREVLGRFRLGLLEGWVVERALRRIEPRHVALATLLGALILFGPIGVLASRYPAWRWASVATSAALAAGALYVVEGVVAGAPKSGRMAVVAVMAGMVATVATRSPKES